MKFENDLICNSDGTVSIKLTNKEFSAVHDAIIDGVESSGYDLSYKTMEILEAFWQHLHSYYHK